MNLIQKVFQNKNDKIPIWLMRQAGRYLPEYRNVKINLNNFWDLCYDIKNTVNVTIQPIERFNLDAAIIFSDILILPHSFGWDIEFQPNIGPILKKFTSFNDLKFFDKFPSNKLNCVYESISNVRFLLPNSKSLIGFSGSPWTLMSYLLEGRGKTNFIESKRFLLLNDVLAMEFLNLLTFHIITHLKNQIKSGADIIQLFDSWAGELSGELYTKFVIEPTKLIVRSLKEEFPNVRIIGFPRRSGYNYDNYIKETNIDCISVDQFTPIEVMRSWQNLKVVQGNLDPIILLSNQDNIKISVDHIINNLQKSNFIFNLGHGVLPNTPVDNVEFLVNYVKSFNV